MEEENSDDENILWARGPNNSRRKKRSKDISNGINAQLLNGSDDESGVASQQLLSASQKRSKMKDTISSSSNSRHSVSSGSLSKFDKGPLTSYACTRYIIPLNIFAAALMLH